MEGANHWQGLAAGGAGDNGEALLTNFEVVEQPTDIGKKQVVDLGLLLEGRLDLGKRVFQVPVLVGKGKRGADLFEARGILPVSQEPIGLQGSRR